MEELSEGKLGRVVSTEEGPSFQVVNVRLDPGKSVRPGQLLYAILDGTPAQPLKTAILRVSSAREWNEYEDPLSSQVRDRFNLQSSRERGDLLRKFILAKTQPIEVVTVDPTTGKYGYEDPTYIVPAGTEVYDSLPFDIAAKVLGFPDPSSDDAISLGTTVGKHTIRVTLSARPVLPRHILIIGSTGTGKSWLLGIISEELHRLGIRHVNFDIHGEMCQSTEELGGVNLVPGKSLTVRLSSLDEPEVLGMLPISNELHLEIVTKAIINLKGSGKPYGIQDLEREALRVAASFSVRDSTTSIISARIAQLKNIPILGTGFDWENALSSKGAIINVDCRSLPYSQQKMVIGAITRELTTLRKRGTVKPHVLSIDEAHLFVPSGDRSSSSLILSELLRMGRHTATGVILVSQSPGDLDKSLAKITNTRFIFAIEPSELNSVAGLLSDAPEDLVRNIPRMRAGTCLMVGSRETVRHATVVQVGLRSTTHGGETPSILD